MAQWWSTSLPRRGSRVRSPSRALVTQKRHPNGCLFCVIRAPKGLEQVRFLACQLGRCSCFAGCATGAPQPVSRYSSFYFFFLLKPLFFLTFTFLSHFRLPLRIFLHFLKSSFLILLCLQFR